MPHIVLKNSSFYQKVLEWNKLDFSVCAYPSYCLFKTRLLGFIRIHRNSIFNFHVIMFKILHQVPRKFKPLQQQQVSL